MDERWYSRKNADDVVLVSRIRLLRNFAGSRFPASMTEEDRTAISEKIDPLVPRMSELLGSPVTRLPLERFSPEEMQALRERQMINKAALASEKKIEVYASHDESFSLTLNSTDHVRLLYSRYGNRLSAIYNRLSPVDELIASQIPYAYSDRFGYKTSTIANVGTGMRAYYVMHLPLMSAMQNFSQMIEEITRYGVVIRNAITDAGKRATGLYVLYNHRSLGLSEKDIMDILTNMAGRLAGQEKDMRMNADRIQLRDRVLRSYGILKYACRMDFYESILHLSNLMLGTAQGILATSGDFSVYELMLGVQPGNLQITNKSLFDEETMKIKRADFLRHFLENIEVE